MSSGVRKVLNMSALLVSGLVIGAGIALLVAPQSGRVARGQIRVNAHRAQDHMTNGGGCVMQAMGELLERGPELIRVK